MGADLSQIVVRTNLALAVAVVVVLLLRGPARRWFGAKTAYRLWLIVPLAMVASVLPKPIGAPNLTLPLGPLPAPAANALAQTPGSTDWLLVLWAAGVVAALVLVAALQQQFMRTLGKRHLDGDGLPILRVRQGYSSGPAVVGVFSPRIVLPADFESLYSPDEQRVILAHERAHLFGHDAQATAGATLLLCLCWFNPLAHIAARLLRIDQELAADATVVAQFPQHERTYAEALFKTQLAARTLPLGCQWPSRSEHPLRQRIALLSNHPVRNRLAALTLALLTIGATATAWAASPRFGLPGPGATRVVVWTLIKAKNMTPDDPQPTVLASGSWTRLHSSLPDGVVYNLQLSPTLLDGGQVRVRALVEHNGVVTEAPPMLLQGSQPGMVRMGNAVLFVTAGKQN